jgi:hypothetical protein
MKFKIADIPQNVIEGFDLYPKTFFGIALVAFGLGLSSAFSQSIDGIIAMASVFAVELVAAWFIGKPLK